MMHKILITADLHFERIETEYIPMIITYIKDTLDSINPQIFCIAGDTVDDANLRAETYEFISLVKFIDEIATYCNNKNIAFVILRGTPSHDGKVVENIHKMLNNFIYVNEIKNMTIKDIDILFIPEMYYPKYEMFQHDLNNMTKSDVVIFHGMLDFAIPQLHQIDSKFNMGRSIVMNSSDLIAKAKHCIVGGHVHIALSSKNIYYTNRIINERGHNHKHRDYGLKLIEFNEYGYKYKNIENPYVIRHEYINLDFDNSTIDILIANSKRENYDKVVFNCIMSNSDIAKQRYQTWKANIPARFIKKVTSKLEEIKEHNLTKTVLKTQDALQILKDTYKRRYEKDIPQSIIDQIIGDEE